MKDKTTRRRTDMHAAVLLFPLSLRELHPELEHQCLHGSCFRLHQLLKLVFPGAEPRTLRAPPTPKPLGPRWKERLR